MSTKTMSVPEFYAGKSLFITGASGFMGKVFIEKLLYSCPGIKTIYITMRPKRGRTIEQRLDEWNKLPVFSRLFAKEPDALNSKLVALPGDISEENLGLSEEHQRLLHDQVNIVFHCAATLKLEADLKFAITFNTLGTWRVIKLCRGIKNLEVLVHVSTAFCHCDMEVLEERIYPTPHDPHEVMHCVEWLDLESVNLISKRLLGEHPNTYTYSKRMAERLIGDEYGKLPTVIARPSIVIPAFEEPTPGWIDSLNGPIGIVVGAGKGVIRSLHCNGEFKAEVIPVDYAINGLITIAWRFCTLPKKPDEIPVYNISTTATKPNLQVTWGEVLAHGRELVKEYPFEMTIWYPDGNIRKSKFVHNLCVIFMHFLPAYFIDALLFIFRQKRFMVRLQWKILEGLNLLQYFTIRRWNFKVDKFAALRFHLNPEDRKTFNMDCDMIEVREYMVNALLGGRHFCMKEDPASIPRCRRNLKILYVIHILFTYLFYFFIGYLIYSYSDTTKMLLDSTVENLTRAPFIRSFANMNIGEKQV